MEFQYYSHNLQVQPIEAATVSLFDVNYAYGYGVYETLRARRGVICFPDQHCARLMDSAAIVGIGHPYTPAQVGTAIAELAERNKIRDANIKVMLVGDSRARAGAGEPDLYILPLNPLFPNRSLYKHGAGVITYPGERHFPHAKTLDMLMSAVAFRQARAAGVYDALLVNRRGEVTEGTRTNLFVIDEDGGGVVTPPARDTLAGVTKTGVLRCIRALGIPVREQPLGAAELARWAGMFLTSTSSKIMPITAVHHSPEGGTAGGSEDVITYTIPEITRNLMRAFDAYINEYVDGQLGTGS